MEFGWVELFHSKFSKILKIILDYLINLKKRARKPNSAKWQSAIIAIHRIMYAFKNICSNLTNVNHSNSSAIEVFFGPSISICQRFKVAIYDIDNIFAYYIENHKIRKISSYVIQLTPLQGKQYIYYSFDLYLQNYNYLNFCEN